jgi:hypothetical protein
MHLVEQNECTHQFTNFDNLRRTLLDIALSGVEKFISFEFYEFLRHSQYQMESAFPELTLT